MSEVAILPYGMKAGIKLAKVPLSELRWPLGAPDDLSGFLGDLGPDDHLIVYPSSCLYYLPRFGVRCKVSVMIVEPAAVHSRHMFLMRFFYRRFHKVLTADRALLDAIPNGGFFVVGSTWVPEWRSTDLTKHKQLSLIASARRHLPGHRLRHEVVDWLREQGIEADILGRGYKPFEHKSDGLAPYRYSIVIENIQEDGYFSEKLVDALLCRTVPIYWGSPRIGDFFDLDGMLICNSLDDIKAAVASLSEADYERRLAVISNNQNRAAKFESHEFNAARIISTGKSGIRELVAS